MATKHSTHIDLALESAAASMQALEAAVQAFKARIELLECRIKNLEARLDDRPLITEAFDVASRLIGAEHVANLIDTELFGPLSSKAKGAQR